MIYMVDHVFDDPAAEPAWHAWYAGYLQKLLSVPGIHSAQRFKATDCTPSRYLAMYSIESEDVYASQGYRNIGGGGSQSARFHPAYRLWTRNLFEGADRAPVVRDGQRVLVIDRGERGGNGAIESRATWVSAVGLHMTTKFRGFIVLDKDEETPPLPGSFVYTPFTPPLSASISERTDSRSSS